MKLPLRLALPLFLAALLVTAAGVGGVLALVRRTTEAALAQERGQFQRIVENSLRERAEALREICGILASLDGPVAARLGQWTHVAVDGAAVLDARSGSARSTAGAGLAAEDRLALARPAPAPGPGFALARAADGGVLLVATAAARGGRDVVVAGQRLDAAFAGSVGALLQADVELLAAGRQVARDATRVATAPDVLPADVVLATAAGAPVTLRVRVPGPGIAAARHEALALAAAGGLLLLALTAGFYAWTLRRVSAPIRELIAAADRVAAGRLDMTLPPDAPAELGALVGQFRAMAASLKEARARLAQSAALSSVGQFVAGISHELNNPLSGLLTHAEYAAGRLKPGEPGAEEVAVILEEGRRLKRILQDLRGLVRPAEAVRVPLDLNLVAGDVLQFVRHEATRAGVRSELALAPDPVTVLGSPDQLRQVVLNLALNALQAMPRGGTLRFVTDRPGGPSAPAGRLAVEDTGAGIPAELLPRLTEPFFTTKPGRMGLGLALCDEIARVHGGTLAIESREGRGTRVALTLPAARA